MSRHLSKEEWLYLVDLYNANDINKFIYEFREITQRDWNKKIVRWNFRKRMKIYLYNNNVEVFMSKTGKKSKGRPKNNISRKTIIKELYNELPDDSHLYTSDAPDQH